MIRLVVILAAFAVFEHVSSRPQLPFDPSSFINNIGNSSGPAGALGFNPASMLNPAAASSLIENFVGQATAATAAPAPADASAKRKKRDV
jgi:hypothetical protein